MEDKDISLMIEKLILIGAMEVSGINAETGEFLYSFTDKLKEIDEKLFNYINESINDNINRLWVLGFLDIDFSKDEPMVRLTDKCTDQQAVDALTQPERDFLKSVMSRFE